MFTELSPYSPLRTESSTIHTPTPTVDAMDAAITAQTNLAADFDFEGDFFLLLRQHYWWKKWFMLLIDIRSTNASAA